MQVNLSLSQWALIRVCVQHYEADIRTACEEDQGTPDGKPGTLGHGIQQSMRDILEALPR